MDIAKIVIAGVLAAVLSSMIKKDSPVFSVMIGMITAALVFLAVTPSLSTLINLLSRLGGQVSTTQPYILTIVKIIGIAYLAEFGTQLCLDAGESAIAGKIELAGKVLIMAVSAPVILSLLTQVTALLP